MPAEKALAGLAQNKNTFRPDLRNHDRRELIKTLHRFEPKIITTDRHRPTANPFKIVVLNFICAKLRHHRSRPVRKVRVTTQKKAGQEREEQLKKLAVVNEALSRFNAEPEQVQVVQIC
jgi:hypothetical protein